MKKNNILNIYFIIILLLFLSLFIINNNYIEKFQGTSSGDNTVYDIIIIAGQSNAVGSGIRNVCDNINLAGCNRSINLRNNTSRVGAIIDVSGYDSIDSSKIKMFTSENDPTNPNNISGMSEPLQTFYRRSIADEGYAKLSLASSFTKEYLARTSMGSRKILVVGCSWSAASMYNSGGFCWRKPASSYPEHNSLYQRTVGRLQNVKNRLSSTNNSKVVAFLWLQGESDVGGIFNNAATRDFEKNRYKTTLKNCLTGRRSEIMPIFRNNNSGYLFPILLGGLPYDQEFNRITARKNPTQFIKDFSDLISEVSKTTDSSYIEKSAFVSSDRLTVGGPRYNFNRRLEGNSIMNASGNVIDNYGDDGNHHFSATSIREFGKRYYYYYDLIK
jgi:hypothetical protein